MSFPEETTASGRPKRRAAEAPPVGPDIEGRDAATGSCHCCGGPLRRAPEVARQCGKCGARYHAYDCGNRRSEAGFTNFDQCPRCAEMCMCAKGPMLCHTRALRDSRRKKRRNSLSEPSTIDGFPTSDSEEGERAARTSEGEGASAGRRAPVQTGDLDSAGDSDGPLADHDDPVARPTGGSCESHPADLRVENEALRMENEALRLETEKLRHSLLALGGFAYKQLTVDEAPSVSAPSVSASIP